MIVKTHLAAETRGVFLIHYLQYVPHGSGNRGISRTIHVYK